MTNADEINLFDLLGTPEELAAEMAEAECARLVAAEDALDAMLAKAAMYYTDRELRLIEASKPCRRAHRERSVRYSRYD